MYPDAVTIEAVTDSTHSGSRKVGLGCLAAVGLRLVLVACLLASVTTVLGAWRNLSFALRSVTVEGRVVRQVEELTADWNAPSAAKPAGPVQLAPARRLLRAIVEFPVGGKAYSVAAQARGPVEIYPLGSRIDVAYVPGRPADAKLKPELPDSWAQSLYLLMGTVLGSGAVYWWWKLIRRRARINPLSDGRSNVSGG